MFHSKKLTQINLRSSYAWPLKGQCPLEQCLFYLVWVAVKTLQNNMMNSVKEHICIKWFLFPSDYTKMKTILCIILHPCHYYILFLPFTQTKGLHWNPSKCMGPKQSLATSQFNLVVVLSTRTHVTTDTPQHQNPHRLWLCCSLIDEFDSDFSSIASMEPFLKRHLS